MMRPRRGRGQPNVALMMLALQMAQVGFTRIPPVTLATIASQVAIFLKLFNIGWPGIMDVCISPITVWYREGYTRLILAAFFHADEWHLYYNMASFLWKGMTLEKRLGSGYFLYLLAVFTILCNTLTVALGMLAEHVLHDPSYLSQCAVGFSGVIFALKVITTHMLPPGTTRIMGFIPVNSRIACWVELVVIQLLVPRVSFLGHLAGILVGTAYCKGPLKTLLNLFIVSPPSYTYVSSASGRTQSSTDAGYGGSGASAAGGGGQFTGAGYTSGHASAPTREQPARTQYTRSQRRGPEYEAYTGGLSEEDQVQRAMEQSIRDSNPAYSRRVEPSAPPGDLDGNQQFNGGPPYPPAGANDHPMPPPPPYLGRNHGNSASPTLPYTGSGQSSQFAGRAGDEGAGAGRLYPDLRTVTGERSNTRRANLDQDDMRRRRLAKFS